MKITFEAPIRIESEMNRREFWAKRKKRFDTQRFLVRLSAPKAKAWAQLAPPYVITMTRIAPRVLDTDNLASGFKACRDEVAKLLSIDDGDVRIEWRYRQERRRPKEYAARIEVEAS